MGGDDLASDDEYLVDTPGYGNLRGTFISSDNENEGSIVSSDDDDDAPPSSQSQTSKKRKGDDNDNIAVPSSSSKKRKKNKKEKAKPTNSKSLLIHAGRGIAMDTMEAQGKFLETIYSHSIKMAESASGVPQTTNANDDDDDDDKSEAEENKQDESSSSSPFFSFTPHLYTPSKKTDTKSLQYQHNNLAAYLQNGLLPSTKRLKNWKNPHSPMILVVTLSARRSVELMKQLSNTFKLPIAKLFAKHMSVEDQVGLLKDGVGGKGGGGGNKGGGGGNNKKRGRHYSLAVGTPGRLLKLLRHNPNNTANDNNDSEEEEDNDKPPTPGSGALRFKHTEVVIIDCHEDSKGWTVCTLNDTRRELMELMKDGVVPQLEKRKGKIKLALF
mmetsp:Transcript_25660/g.43794  ORF Transcript_25660/g.43794 Transcript_25660/m.43794 type:complete len:384 (+) Transcript_25660:223-1374(+)|eukprot:CAMPEP_0183709442 /NCGR_PEP_ID=MMETSP0737-20130205/5492_1 /TAXON_ID=385413 /ORGANISM="Thalassiosira miniscula, Strain CCMP1093" /LENGTH=383 /DNA_ID=CAMNT_0025937551 /DNA_START=79 /DNA_END=1230 /DNA_ORIENTATION=-